MSLQKPKAMYTANKQQYTAAGGEVQVLQGGIYEWGKQEQKIDTWIGKANAVLREFYRSMVTKRELSNTAKSPVLKPVFVPNHTCGHECWVMSESDILGTSGGDGIFV